MNGGKGGVRFAVNDDATKRVKHYPVGKGGMQHEHDTQVSPWDLESARMGLALSMNPA